MRQCVSASVRQCVSVSERIIDNAKRHAHAMRRKNEKPDKNSSKNWKTETAKQTHRNSPVESWCLAGNQIFVNLVITCSIEVQGRGRESKKNGFADLVLASFSHEDPRFLFAKKYIEHSHRPD